MQGQGNWQALAELMRGFSLSQSGRGKEALEAYGQAAELDPAFYGPWNAKGFALGAEGRYHEALEAYEKAIELNPAFAFAWNGKGYMLGAAGRIQEALTAYRRAIELAPGFAYPWSGAGNMLSAAGEFEGALAAYRMACELDPAFAFPWYGQAMLLKAHPELETAAGCRAQQSFCRAVYLRQTYIQKFPLPASQLLDGIDGFHLPLLAHRLFEEGGQAGISCHADLFRTVMEACAKPLAVLSFLDLCSALSPTEKLLFRGLVCREYGDPIQAHALFDALDSAEETNLAGQYHLVLSLKEFCEPNGKELAFALDRANVVRCDAGSSVSLDQLYYAGQLFRLAGDEEKAEQCLGRTDRQKPPLLARLHDVEETAVGGGTGVFSLRG